MSREDERIATSQGALVLNLRGIAVGASKLFPFHPLFIVVINVGSWGSFGFSEVFFTLVLWGFHRLCHEQVRLSGDGWFHHRAGPEKL